MSKTYYKTNNSTLDSIVTLPSFEVNVLKGDNKMMIKTTDKTNNISEVEILSLKKNLQPFSTLPLIQEGQLSVTGERLGTKYW